MNNTFIRGSVKNGMPTLPDDFFDSGDESTLSGYQPCRVQAWSKPIPVKENRLTSRTPAILRDAFSRALFFVVLALLIFFVGVQIGRSAPSASAILQESKQ